MYQPHNLKLRWFKRNKDSPWQPKSEHDYETILQYKERLDEYDSEWRWSEWQDVPVESEN
jgi:hypothetical protein